MNDTTLTVGETCEILHIGENAVLKLIDSGELPAARLGKAYTLTLGDVMAYLRKQIDAQTEARRARQGGNSIPAAPQRKPRRSARTDAIVASLGVTA